MTPDIVFTWVAVLSFGINAFRLFRQQQRIMALWFAGLAGLCLMLGLAETPGRGMIAGGLWLVYSLLVETLNRLDVKALMRRDWRRAQLHARIRCLILPLKPVCRQLWLLNQTIDLEQNPDAALPANLNADEQLLLES